MGIDAAGGHEQIGKSVVVEVDHAGAPADVACLNANLCRTSYVLKVALAIVVIEAIGVLCEVGFENIEMAVQIVIADPDSHAGLLHAVFAERHSAQHTFFRKFAFPIVDE